MFHDNQCIGCDEIFPLEITCPFCGGEISLWSDELETVCKLCGYAVFNHERYVN